MSHPLTLLPQSDPAAVLRYRDRQYAADLIGAALLHFDFFTWLLRNGPASDEKILAHFGMQARPLDVLLTLCRANGFLETLDSGLHTLSDVGREYLVSDSPWFMGPYYQPIKDSPILLGFVKVLTTGKPANWQAKDDAHDWHASMRDPVFAKSFTDLMNCRGKIFGQYLAKALAPHWGSRQHLLDVAGGSGIYAAAMVATHPTLTATVFEQAPVDALCRAEIEAQGLSDRISVQSGDMFQQAWPAADVILLSNVLHDWDWPEMQELVHKAVASLPTNGLLIIHDAFINEAKTGPLAVVEYSSLLMNITQGKCYSTAEYTTVLQNAGCTVGCYEDTIGDRGFLTATKIG